MMRQDVRTQDVAGEEVERLFAVPRVRSGCAACGSR